MRGLGKRVFSRRALLGGIGAAGLTGWFAGDGLAAPPGTDVETAITVNAAPIPHFRIGKPDETRFGALVFRGGLELTSNSRAFGGLSGIAMRQDGSGFLAVADVGLWFSADLTMRAGRPFGLDNAIVAPIIGADGRALRLTPAFDTEGLALGADGIAYVSIERVNEVRRFDYGREGLKARGRPIPLPPSVADLPFNRGLECIGFAPASGPLAGGLVAIAERSGSENAPTRGYILTGPLKGEFDVTLSDGFEATDLTFLPGGDLLLLERRYSPLRGVAMRIRRIAGASIRPGATLDGAILIEADMGYQVDNMEALGLHREASGTFVLTILSDDNFSAVQRNILLQFTYDAAA